MVDLQPFDPMRRMRLAGVLPPLRMPEDKNPDSEDAEPGSVFMKPALADGPANDAKDDQQDHANPQARLDQEKLDRQQRLDRGCFQFRL